MALWRDQLRFRPMARVRPAFDAQEAAEAEAVRLCRCGHTFDACTPASSDDGHVLLRNGVLFRD